MRLLSSERSVRKNIFLALSMATNIVLLAACAIALQKMKTVYTDYRHFRSLPVGISEASTSAVVDNAVVLFGDSRVETWTPLPALSGKTVINAGVTGETTSEMRRRFDNDVLRLKPQTVIIQAGMNDLTASVTRNIPTPQLILDRMFDNLEFFVSTLTESGTQVVVTSIIPNKDLNLLRKVFWHPDLQKSVTDTNQQLKKLAEKHQAIWLDINDVFIDSNNTVRTELYRDTLHVKSPAYVQVNELLNKLFPAPVQE